MLVGGVLQLILMIFAVLGAVVSACTMRLDSVTLQETPQARVVYHHYQTECSKPQETKSVANATLWKEREVFAPSSTRNYIGPPRRVVPIYILAASHRGPPICI